MHWPTNCSTPARRPTWPNASRSASTPPTCSTPPRTRSAELEWLAADGSVAREVFIQSNLRLALATSRKFRTRGHTEDDVIQDAYHGLVKAVDRFDYTKGFKFSTYAVWWIRESILTGLRGTGFVRHPEVLWNQIVKVRAVRLRLLDETGTMPTDAAIAAACGFSVREVARCVHADRRVTSLQTPVGEHDMTLGDLISDDAAAEVFDAVEDGVDRKAMCGIVSAALAGLDPSVAAVVLARYGLDGRAPRSLSVVAEELGLHRQTVRHREQTGLYALRHPDVASRLREYRSLST
jgi:RNA polymerase primary sigma factor